MKRLICAALMAFTASQMAEAAYKCKDGNGKTVYSDIRCADDAETIKTEERKSLSGPSRVMGKTPETADEVMTFGSTDFVQAYIPLLLLTSRKIGDAPQDQGNACLERYRSSFKNPRSAYLVASTLYESKKDRFVHVDVSAQNSFGGATRTALVCSIPTAKMP